MATLVVGTLGSFVPALAFETATWTNLARADVLLALIGLGCLGSGLSYLLFYYLIRVGGAEFATLVTYLVPVTALWWGTLLLGEPLTPNLLVGLSLILAGVFLAGRKPEQSSRRGQLTPVLSHHRTVPFGIRRFTRIDEAERTSRRN